MSEPKLTLFPQWNPSHVRADPRLNGATRAGPNEGEFAMELKCEDLGIHQFGVIRFIFADPMQISI